MTVYVDDFNLPATIGNIKGKWSHLIADHHDELMQFAISLGLRPSWVQNPHSYLEHFDITARKRKEAIAAGAVKISYLEAGKLIQAKKDGVPFDLEK